MNRNIGFLFVIFAVCSSLVIDKDFQSFVEYETKFNLSFTPEERLERFTVFKTNLARIEKWNKEMPSATFGITKFTHWTDDEISKFLLPSSVMDVPRPDKPQALAYSGKIPSYFDWREKNAVTSVKNQQSCGDCYAFATTAAVESAYAIKYGMLKNLSEQEITDCDPVSQGCDWGLLFSAMDLVRDTGLVPLKDYPYENQKGTCKIPSDSPRVKITGNTWLKPDEDLIANAVASEGPVAVGIMCPRSLFHYIGGVLDLDAATCLDDFDGNHAVVIVGFKADEYWIIKNSWGSDWGENGYFRAVRGKNFCSITTEPRIVHM